MLHVYIRNIPLLYIPLPFVYDAHLDDNSFGSKLTFNETVSKTILDQYSQKY